MKYMVNFEVSGHVYIEVDASSVEAAARKAEGILEDKKYDTLDILAELYSVTGNGNVKYFA